MYTHMYTHTTCTHHTRTCTHTTHNTPCTTHHTHTPHAHTYTHTTYMYTHTHTHHAHTYTHTTYMYTHTHTTHSTGSRSPHQPHRAECSKSSSAPDPRHYPPPKCSPFPWWGPPPPSWLPLPGPSGRALPEAPQQGGEGHHRCEFILPALRVTWVYPSCSACDVSLSLLLCMCVSLSILLCMWCKFSSAQVCFAVCSSMCLLCSNIFCGPVHVTNDATSAQVPTPQRLSQLTSQESPGSSKGGQGQNQQTTTFSERLKLLKMAKKCVPGGG